MANIMSQTLCYMYKKEFALFIYDPAIATIIYFNYAQVLPT